MRKLLAITLIAVALGLLWFSFGKSDRTSERLQVSCPAAFSKIVRVAAQQYEKEMGARIEIDELERRSDEDLVFDFTSEIEEEKKNGAVKEVISVARFEKDTLSIAVLSTCVQPAAALRFARYLAAPEKGGPFISKFGMVPIPGDAWAPKPDLILYSGGVNRPAIEKLLSQFSEREGIELTTVFNGCGILCAAMKTMTDPGNPRFPDVYFACDVCFVPPVADRFPEVILLTETDIGIAVPIENPHGIKTLIDLAKPGLKVGLCNQEQSTLGYMTGGILRSSGLEKSIRKNVVVEVPTADFLITQMRSGALDAAIVYRVNAELQKASIQFIKINHEGARAIQPFSVRADSTKHQLAMRLQDHFLAHPETFEETGFTWRGNEGVMKSSDIKVPQWLLGK